MHDLTEKVNLNRVANQILDLLEKEGVKMRFNHCRQVMYFEKGEATLNLEEVTRTTAYDMDRPPRDWDEFLARATDVHVEKDRDYRSRFMRQLVKLASFADNWAEARAVWKWETEKKFDRIRTWVETGSLAVKGEGVANSVVDAFNYTVQYLIWAQARNDEADPLTLLSERDFYYRATRLNPNEYVGFWEKQGLLQPGETEVKAVLLKYMGAADA